MLSITGLNHFYYVRDFTDMRCKHNRVLSIIRERFHRERSYSLFEKKFVSGYQFMKIEQKGVDTIYIGLTGKMWF